MKPLLTILVYLICLKGSTQDKEILFVYFDFDEYSLTEIARARLDSFLFNSKSQKGDMKYEISGHCDSKGPDAYNDLLSKKRVMTVKNFMVTYGISPDNILSAQGFGKRKPVNDNVTEEERKFNRRVEVTKLFSSKIIPQKNDEVKTLKEKVADSATVSGTNIVLNNINFYGGRHQFLPSSQPELIDLLETMKAYPSLIIRIEGHICCQPDDRDGLDAETMLYNLSEARAKAVMTFLLSNGISSDRLSFIGFGHSMPLYPFPEQNEEQRVANRRVEIKIIKK